MDQFGHDIPEQVPPSVLKAHAPPRVEQLIDDLTDIGDEELSQLSKDLDRLREAIPTEFARRREHYLQMAAKFGVPAVVPLKKGKGAKPRKASTGGGATLPMKYINPENSAEGWSGRGMNPRWMSKAINASGGRLRKDDFLVGGAAHYLKRDTQDMQTEEAA